MTQTRDRSATVKHGVVPACSSCPGVISFSTTVPAIGARIDAPACRPTRLACAVSAMVCGGHVERDERLQRGVAVGLGADGVGLRLRGFALRDAVVLQQVLVDVGELAVGLRRGERLAVGC